MRQNETATFVSVPDFLITTMVIAIVLVAFVDVLNSIVTSLMPVTLVSELEIRAPLLLDGRGSNECCESTGEEHE
jgi:hypothetical protein